MKHHTHLVLITIAVVLAVIDGVYAYKLAQTYLAQMQPVQPQVELENRSNTHTPEETVRQAPLLNIHEAGISLAESRANLTNLNVSPEVYQAAKQRVSEQYQELEMLATLAVASGFTVSESLVQRALHADIAEHGGPDGHAAFLSEHRLSAETYEALVRMRVTADAYVTAQVQSRITDELLQAMYQQMLADDPELPPYDQIMDEVRENAAGELTASVRTELLTQSTTTN